MTAEELAAALADPPRRYESSQRASRYREARNTCPKCLKRDRLERRNYNMMWEEADLYCGRCDVKIRNMDFW